MDLFSKKHHFEYLIDLENHRHEERVNEIKYWDSVVDKFHKRTKKHPLKFEMEFKHIPNRYYDNELLIEKYANDFGYEIYNEELFADKSIYYFRKMKKHG